MLSDFEIITRHFPENNDIKIYPISDVHLGAAEHLAAEWDNFCKRIWITVLVLIVMLVATNGAWILY